MFKKGYWVHKNSMDVFYEVVKVQWIGPKYTKVKYKCWNKNESGKPYLILSKTFKAKIMRKNYNDWSSYPYLRRIIDSNIK